LISLCIYPDLQRIVHPVSAMIATALIATVNIGVKPKRMMSGARKSPSRLIDLPPASLA
jgi:hypothetical protein